MKITKTIIFFITGIFITFLLYCLSEGKIALPLIFPLFVASLIALLCAFISIKKIKTIKNQKLFYFLSTYISYILIVVIFGELEVMMWLPIIIAVGIPFMLPIVILNLLGMRNLLNKKL